MLGQRIADNAAAQHHVDHTGGRARFMQHRHQRMGGGGGGIGGLEDDSVAEGQRRGDLPGRNGDGEIPRRDHAIDAQRFAVGLDFDARTHRVQILAVTAQRLTGEILEDAPGANGFADGFGKGLAFLARQQLADGFLALDDQGAGLVENVGAHFRGRGGPAGERGAGGFDGLVDVFGAAVRKFGDHFLGVGGVDAFERTGGGDLLAADEMGQGLAHKISPKRGWKIAGGI